MADTVAEYIENRIRGIGEIEAYVLCVYAGKSIVSVYFIIGPQCNHGLIATCTENHYLILDADLYLLNQGTGSLN